MLKPIRLLLLPRWLLKIPIIHWVILRSPLVHTEKKKKEKKIGTSAVSVGHFEELGLSCPPWEHGHDRMWLILAVPCFPFYCAWTWKSLEHDDNWGRRFYYTEHAICFSSIYLCLYCVCMCMFGHLTQWECEGHHVGTGGSKDQLQVGRLRGRDSTYPLNHLTALAWLSKSHGDLLVIYLLRELGSSFHFGKK